MSESKYSVPDTLLLINCIWFMSCMFSSFGVLEDVLDSLSPDYILEKAKKYNLNKEIAVGYPSVNSLHPNVFKIVKKFLDKWKVLDIEHLESS